MKKVSIQHVLYFLVIIGIIIFTLACKRKNIDKTIIKSDSSYVKKETIRWDSNSYESKTKIRLYNLQGNFDYNVVNESFDVDGLKIKFWKDGTNVNKIYYKIILKDSIKESIKDTRGKLIIEDSLSNKKVSDIKIKETQKSNNHFLWTMIGILFLLILSLLFFVRML